MQRQFFKNKFKFVILENLQKKRRFVRIIPNLFLSCCHYYCLLLLFNRFSIKRRYRIHYSWFIITLVSGIFSTLKVLTRKRLVQKMVIVLLVLLRKRLRIPYWSIPYSQPKGKK